MLVPIISFIWEFSYNLFRRRMGKGRTRKAHEQIRRVMDELGHASFSKLIEKTELAHNTLALNLHYLKDIGELDCIEAPDPRNPEIKRRVWVKLVPITYHKAQALGIVREIVKEKLYVGLGTPRLAPSFSLSSSEAHSPEDKKLDDAAIDGFMDNIGDELICHLPAKKQEMILGFAARCLWLGFVGINAKYRKIHGREVMEGYVATNLKDLLLLETAYDEYAMETLSHYMLEGMETTLETGKQESKEIVCGIKSIPLSAYKARLLTCVLVKMLFSYRGWAGHFAHINEISRVANLDTELKVSEIDEIQEKVKELCRLLSSKLEKRLFTTQLGDGAKDTIFFSIETIPVDVGKNMEWIKAHKREFLDFIKEVDKIRFAEIVAVGFPQLENWPLELDIPKRVDDFLKALATVPSWENRIFELEALANMTDRIIYRMGHMEGEKAVSIELDGETQYAFNYAFGRMATPLILYKHDPRSRRLEWWRGLKEKLKQALKTVSPRSCSRSAKISLKE